MNVFFYFSKYNINESSFKKFEEFEVLFRQKPTNLKNKIKVKLDKVFNNLRLKNYHSFSLIDLTH